MPAKEPQSSDPFDLPEFASLSWPAEEIDALKQRFRDVTMRMRAAGLNPNLKRALRRVRTLHKAIAPKWIDDVPPPNFGEFCEQLDGLELLPRQEKWFREACLWTAEDFMRGDRDIQELILMVGKGGGKDWIAARFISWVSLIVLSLVGDAGPYFGLNKTDKLYIINVAPTGQQAREIFFGYLEANLRCKLFDKFFPKPTKQIYRDGVRFYDSKWGIAVKRLFILSKNSNSSSLEGYNVLAWIMDEADDFKVTESGSKAVTIRKQFRSSAATRMGNRSIGIIISYPRTDDGFMMSLKDEVEADIKQAAIDGRTSSYYFDLACTWDVRPDVNIKTNRIMQQDYASDPRRAAAMYECKPEAAIDAFFDAPERILALSNNERIALIDAYTDVIDTEMQDGTLNQAISLLAHWGRTARQPGKAYFITADAGLSGDGYAICIVSSDQTSNAWMWVCPECQREYPEALRSAGYHQAGQDDLVKGETINCGCCDCTPYFYHHSGAPKDWLRRNGALIQQIAYGTKQFHIPMIQEEFIFCIDPIKPSGPGKSHIIVDFPGVFAFLEQAAMILRPEMIRVDPWNQAHLVQGLKRSTKMDVDVMQFSNAEQFKRARLAKAVAYAGLFSMLNAGVREDGKIIKHTRRDNQWVKLVRKGGRVDHPPGGEKDMYDTEVMGIWLASVYNDKSIEFSFS